MKTDNWKQIRISPEAENVIIQHLVRKISKTGKAVSKQDIANELILKHKLEK